MSSDRILERTAIRLERYVTAINDSVPDCRGIAKAAMPWSFRPVSFSRAEIPWLIYEREGCCRRSPCTLARPTLGIAVSGMKKGVGVSAQLGKRRTHLGFTPQF